MKPLRKCPKCHGKGRVQLPPTYPPRPSEYTYVECQCVKRVPKGIALDLLIGEAAALEDLIATCDTDIGEFKPEHLTERQKAAMWDALDKLKIELTARRNVILTKL